MAKIFDQIQLTKPRRNVFDLSHERKMSMNMGDLVPCMVQEVLPGDSFRVKMEHLIRLQALQAPMMHRVNVYTHFFFVPNRLVWNQFEDFITGGEDGTKKPVFPRATQQIGSSQYRELFEPGSLADYMGVPTINTKNQVAPLNINISLLPFRAYQLIYNEFYRDQNLTSPIPINKSSTTLLSPEDVLNTFTLRKRAWEKDYFTSALPFAQRGQQLSIPLSQSRANLKADVNDVTVGTKRDSSNYDIAVSSSTAEGQQLYTDLSNVTGSTINELRSAFQIQKWLEKSARGGARYVENILAHFGVRSSDARLQRPEYLGGGKSPVIISEVLQQSATEPSSPLGEMGGHGISVGSSNSFKKKFEEHGYVIGIMSVLPRTSYQNGLPRHFQKFDKFDYFWPEFAHLGEQPVKNSELYYNMDVTTDNDKTFGYQPRYCEYRFAQDTVHGDFTDTLKFWHMGRDFTSLPPLNTNFVEAKPTDRVFAVASNVQDTLLVQTYVNFQAIRPIPKFGNPGGI